MGRLANSINRASLSGRGLVAQICTDAIRSIGFLARTQASLTANRSYSQFGEDRVIDSLLPEYFGSYVDIGAGHPVRNSNTFLLYRRGWRGTLVEPIESLAAYAKKKRPRDEVLRCVVTGDSHPPKSAQFWEFNPTELSTTDASRASQLQRGGANLQSTYSCEIRSVGSLLRAVSPSEPFLLSIDVEGADYGVLQAVDWSIFTPRVICVEDPERLTGQTTVSHLLENVGYELVSQHTVSSIYLFRTGTQGSCV